MTHYKITIENDYYASTTKVFSQMIRNYEAPDLECAMKQAKKDIEAAQRIFPEWKWALKRIEEIEAKP